MASFRQDLSRRAFLTNAAKVTLMIPAGLSAQRLLAATDLVKARCLRDNFWLWGQNAGSHHLGSPEHGYRLPGTNRMQPLEGCAFFGIKKCLRVTMKAGPFPPFDGEAEKLKRLDEVVWSAIGARGAGNLYDQDHSDLDAVLEVAGKFPNITGAVLDDFFAGTEESGKSVGRHSLASIRSMRERLHAFSKRPLDLWMVWYTYQLNFKVAEYLELCDVITLWTWKGSNLDRLDENIEKCIAKTPGKRRYLGIYLWNYGEAKPLEPVQMHDQLERAYRWLKSGEIEGLIFCSNAIADIGLPTADYARQWIAKIGDERI
jgi:hypothetical protein